MTLLVWNELPRGKKTVAIIILIVLVVVLDVMIVNSGVPLFVLSLLIAIAVLLLAYALDTFFKIGFRPYHYVLLTIVVITGPTLVPFHLSIIFYDKIMHFIHPVLLSPLVRFVVSKLNIRKYQSILLVFFIVISFFAIYEAGEYLIDTKYEFGLQGVYQYDDNGNIVVVESITPLDDTMQDMIAVILGSAVYLAGSMFVNRKRLSVYDRSLAKNMTKS